MNTNSTINAQVFQCLSYIADDEISKQKFCKDIVEVWQQMEDAKAGKFDLEKCNLISYSHGQYYSLGENLGKFGFSVKK